MPQFPIVLDFDSYIKGEETFQYDSASSNDAGSNAGSSPSVSGRRRMHDSPITPVQDRGSPQTSEKLNPITLSPFDPNEYAANRSTISLIPWDTSKSTPTPPQKKAFAETSASSVQFQLKQHQIMRSSRIPDFVQLLRWFRRTEQGDLIFGDSRIILIVENKRIQAAGPNRLAMLYKQTQEQARYVFANEAHAPTVLGIMSSNGFYWNYREVEKRDFPESPPRPASTIPFYQRSPQYLFDDYEVPVPSFLEEFFRNDTSLHLDDPRSEMAIKAIGERLRELNSSLMK